MTAFATGNKLLREGKLEEAIASYEKAIKENPRFAWSYQNLGEALEKVGRIEEAIAAFRQAVAINPQSPWSLYKLGVMLSQQGQFQEGVGYLNRALDLKKDVPEFYLGLGSGLLKLGQWSEAVECVDRAVGMLDGKVGTFHGTSLQAEAYFYLAEAKSGQQQWSEAVEFYRRSWEVNPGRVDCCIGWAVALGKLGRWSEAVELYRQGVVWFGESGEVLFGLGQALGQLGRWEEAIVEYRRAIGFGFAGAEVRHHLGYALGQLGRWEEAVVEYRLVVEINPKSAQVRHQLGYGLMRLGRWREAEVELRKAVELHPGSAVVWQQLGDVLLELGKRDEAEEAYRRALELKPGLAVLKERLAGLLSTEKDSSVVKIARTPAPDASTLNSKSQKSNPPVTNLPSESPEQTWLRFNKNNKKLVRQIERINTNLVQNSFSVVIPVYNPPIDCLRECIESVISQTYENYDVIIVDDCSTKIDVRQYLESVAQHPRITVHWREKNGHISQATNDGSYTSTKDYLVFVDNDDLLEIHALATVNLYISRYTPDILYTDEMRTDATGKERYGVKFKPGYSPELLLAFCYFSHLVVMRRTIFNAVGGFRVGYEGSQDHDLWLRATEVTNRVTHIPQKLYVRRVIPGSTAAGGDQKSYAYSAAEKALQEAFERRGVTCSIRRPDWAVKKGYGIYHPVFAHEGLGVHIVVTTDLKPTLIKPFLETLNKTLYKNFKVTFICKCFDESLFQSRKQEVFKDFNFKYDIKFHDCQGVVSHSEIRNIAAANIKEDLILFLSDEVELRRESWLSQMVGWIQLPGVSVVGLKFIDSSTKVLLNCGMAHGFNFGTVGPVFKQARAGSRGHQYLAAVTRNVSSVSGSCLLIKSATFKRVGGFDARHFPDTYSDVDLCYRIADITDKRIVQCNEIAAINHEVNTLQKNPIAIAQYKKIYGQRFEPYLNPCINLLRYDMTPSNRIVSEDNEEIRVALISHNLNNEGAPISLFQLALYLAKQPQCSVNVWSPTLGPLKAEYENAGINVLIGIQNSSIQDFKSMNKYGDALEKQTTIFSYIKDNTNCNVVITNTVLNFWAVNAARDLGVAAVWIIRESEGVTNGRFRRAEEPVVNAVFQAFRNAYKVVYVAKETLEVYKQEFDHHNYEVIPNGLHEPDRFAGVNTEHRRQTRMECGFGENDFVVCQVGTICKRKNQLELVEAFAQVKNTITTSEIKLLLVGYREEDSYGRNLVEFVEKLPEMLRSCITIIPETSNVCKYFQCADIFCFTSKMESYPRVLLEAMAARLPIITTKIMGTQSQIFPGFNGDFYESGNQYDLALKIISFFLSKEKWKKYRENSRFAFQSLTSYDEMGEKYFDILQSAVLYSPSEK